MAGTHQRDNAMLAFAIGRRLGFPREACERGAESAFWPGRLERISTPTGVVLFDAAHNPDGAAALAHELSAESPERTALVFGALADKDWRGMLAVLAPHARVRAYASPLGRVAVDPRALAAEAEGAIFSSGQEALAHARTAVGPAGLVVVAGSIGLVGELRSALLGLPRDPPVSV